jgi:S1-C subfamily serine protease
MKHLPVSVRGALVLVLSAATAHADESLAPETARRLKESTVYIKVAIGPLAMSGSGFVIQTDGNSALIATNQHVVTKPKVLAPLGFIPGLRGRDRLALMRIQQTLAANEAVVSVVFNSGEPNEQLVKAELLCQLEDPDMAVLRVSSLKSVPRAIEFRQTAQPTETMPVYILGFPFGESLSANKANPNITIGKGSVSSIRKDASGKVVKVQIDGALNPGNSGGPVVDAKGNLVGIAVQTIQGSNIGLTIPSGELNAILEGGLGKPTVTVAPAVNGASPRYQISVPLIDPLRKLKSASVRFVTKPVPSDPTKAGRPQLPSDAASRDLDLSAKGGLARVDLPLDAKAPQPVKQVTVQASFVNGEGKTVYLDPQVVAVPAPVQVTTTTDGKSTTTTTIIQGGDGTTTRRQMTVTRGGAAAPGAAPKGAFKVGDKVLVEWAGKTETAEVIDLPPTGWVRVKFPRDGIVLTPTLPPDRIKPAAAPETKKAAPDAIVRTWTTKAGRFTVRAKFVALNNGSVTLEKENGETLTVDLDKLSEADQKTARQLAEESEGNPFATKSKRP